MSANGGKNPQGNEMTNATGPLVLTVAEAAGQLRVDEKTIRRMLSRGRLRGAIVGRHWRIPRVAVEELLGIAAPASPPPLGLPDRVPDGGRPGRPRKVRRRCVVVAEPAEA
jgi:excisionase family DNA binding protein